MCCVSQTQYKIRGAKAIHPPQRAVSFRLPYQIHLHIPYYLPEKGLHSFCKPLCPGFKASNTQAAMPSSLCRESLLTLVGLTDLCCAKVFKVQHERQVQPFLTLSSSLSFSSCVWLEGASSLHAPLHPLSNSGTRVSNNSHVCSESSRIQASTAVSFSI